MLMRFKRNQLYIRNSGVWALAIGLVPVSEPDGDVCIYDYDDQKRARQYVRRSYSGVVPATALAGLLGSPTRGTTRTASDHMKGNSP